MQIVAKKTGMDGGWTWELTNQPTPSKYRTWQADRDLLDEGVAHRPHIGNLEVIGAEPAGTVCEYCKQSDGNVLLVRNPFQCVRSTPLHEHCAEHFFRGGMITRS